MKHTDDEDNGKTYTVLIVTRRGTSALPLFFRMGATMSVEKFMAIFDGLKEAHGYFKNRKYRR